MGLIEFYQYDFRCGPIRRCNGISLISNSNSIHNETVQCNICTITICSQPIDGDGRFSMILFRFLGLKITCVRHNKIHSKKENYVICI